MTALFLFAIWSVLYLAFCFIIGNDTKATFYDISKAVITWFICAISYGFGYFILSKLFF